MSLADLDRKHLWHPFTPMRQWCDAEPTVIVAGDGPYLLDDRGCRYLDGVSSLWCNVHGHRASAIDAAIRDQLDKIAHSTLLGLASEASVRFAAELVARVPRGLTRVFYSDAGATALEVAFKMAVGYWFHIGQPRKSRFIAMRGAYHGDTTGAMSVGFSDLFHRPFASMCFPVTWFASPHDHRIPKRGGVGLDPQMEPSLAELEMLLDRHAQETAAVVLEPVMQGAAGMHAQPAGFVKRVAELCRQQDVLLIADEVATGFGRTGSMFACDQEDVRPDLLCLAKGITGGYLPLAVTLSTERIFEAFTGQAHEQKTLFHGHTYTGNALACAAASASLGLFDRTRLLEHIHASSDLLRQRLSAIAHLPGVVDVRQRGIMAGIEIDRPAAPICLVMRKRGVILRPLGNVVVLMPIPAMSLDLLQQLLDVVTQTLKELAP